MPTHTQIRRAAGQSGRAGTEVILSLRQALLSTAQPPATPLIARGLDQTGNARHQLRPITRHQLRHRRRRTRARDPESDLDGEGVGGDQGQGDQGALHGKTLVQSTISK